jgi:aspartyl-tRNA(Asn)/glutamyl-tRNA(Gln) amidotransferase subunit B
MIEPRRRLSSIDLSRAGTGLMEIVSKPDMRCASGPHFDSNPLTPLLHHPDHQRRPVSTSGPCRLCLDPLLPVMETWSRSILLDGVSTMSAHFSQGSLRCDVNVSVNRQGQAPGTRCEIKNLNSVRFMVAAISNAAFPSI